MTTTELQDYGLRCLSRAVEQLRETGTPLQAFHVLQQDRTDVIFVPGDEMNDPVAKDNIAEAIRERIRETNARAYFMVGDAFISRVDPKDTAAVLKNRLRQRLGMTIEQAAQAGLCTVSEVLQVVCETRDEACIIMQEYIRDPQDNSKVMVVGEPEIKSGITGNGRFLGMFKPAAPGDYHGTPVKQNVKWQEIKVP
jgi:hypothetical protein